MNPEFERNLWLEASPRRIAWAGVVLALIYGAAVLVASRVGGGALEAIRTIGWGVFAFCGLVWGFRAAGGSLMTEISEGTWEFQRLSSLDPWSMTWGKVFGGASLAWLCALTGLIAIGAAGAGLGEPGLLWSLVSMASFAVLLQAVGLAAALIGVRKARAEGRMARSGGVVAGLVAGTVLLLWMASITGFRDSGAMQGVSNAIAARGAVDWWGEYWPADLFRALMTPLLAAWALAAAWRLMRLELQMQNAPVIWPTFLIFVALVAAGFGYRPIGLGASLLSAALAVALCAYAAAFAEPADRVRLRQFAKAVRGGAVVRAGMLAPAALAPVVLALLLAMTGLAHSGWQAPGGLEAGAVLAMLVFVVRDLGVIALFRLGPRPQRGDFGAVVALGLLYAVGAILGGVLAQDIRGAAVFAPAPGAAAISLVSGVIQAAIAWWLAARRIRMPEVSTAAPKA